MRSLRFSFFFFLFLSTLAFAAAHFPELTGRVVDDAHLLSDESKVSLEQTLENYEDANKTQVVVVTVKSLEGNSIEEYGYQLGRYWQIGQKGINNGVLLLIAPTERKVRIEAGYGVEPLLTDAASSEIVNAILLPAFKAGNMEKGIVDGTQAILKVLGGDIPPAGYHPHATQPQIPGWLALLIFMCFIIFSIRHPYASLYLLSSSSSRFGSGQFNNSNEGSRFSGGGGSFGGGGASGSW